MRCVFSAAVLAILAAPVLALGPGERVGNFRLLDHEGESHELYYLSDAAAVVLMVHGNDCPAVREALPAYAALAGTYGARGVAFRLLNSSDDRAAIVAEARERGVDLPILVDDTRLIGEALGVESRGEVFVIDPKSWQITYRGGLSAADAGGSPVAAALDAMLAGQVVAVTATEAKGCAAPAQARPAALTYAADVAPILAEKCVACHREGGIGPWVMSDYEMVRGFAPMIREVVNTKRMPPWHADPAYGHFENDRSLSIDQARTLVHWVEQGAVRGEGADPLAELDVVYPEWQLGPPDLVVDIPAFEVPATGVVEYQYQQVKNPYDRDVWVRATEIIPGDRKALHHVITTFTTPDENGQLDRRRSQSLGGYVPGSEADQFPEGTGTLVPANAVFTFQMHYTTNGKASVDESRLGVYFHEARPEHVLGGAVLMNTKISIPANTKDHEESASRVLDGDVLVYSLLPHAHFRGKASEFKAIYPDGREEILLSVPKYDFNWQTTYNLAEPKVLPKGTTIVHSTRWDNSKQNPANPDHNRVVPWGEQTWDEMLFGAINWRYLDGEKRDTNLEVTRDVADSGD